MFSPKDYSNIPAGLNEWTSDNLVSTAKKLACLPSSSEGSIMIFVVWGCVFWSRAGSVRGLRALQSARSSPPFRLVRRVPVTLPRARDLSLGM